jgi:hypothetical protein
MTAAEVNIEGKRSFIGAEKLLSSNENASRNTADLFVTYYVTKWLGRARKSRGVEGAGHGVAAAGKVRRVAG